MRLAAYEVSPLATPGSTEPVPGGRVDLSVVIPTYNERANISELIARVSESLEGTSWALLFVDDDSPDGTADLITEYARRDYRIRLIRRIGRRGLSSACIEGVMSTTSNYIAIMDADMQHDEAILPRMLDTLRSEQLDVVVGTRNAQGGSMGNFARNRQLLSRLGQRASNSFCHCEISDPMSGFFLFTRTFFFEVVHSLDGRGFKILVDMLACARRPVKLGEVGYTFRSRRHGDSKLDVNTAVSYVFLILGKSLDRLTDRMVPIRFAVFSVVGGTGMALHLVCLAYLLFGLHWHFLAAQIAATFVAMTENFFLNNAITWRENRLRGSRLVAGLFTFWFACSFGAWVNILFARAMIQRGFPWYSAGLAGVALSSVWNYTMAQIFVWQHAGADSRHSEAGKVPVYEADLSS